MEINFDFKFILYTIHVHLYQYLYRYIFQNEKKTIGIISVFLLGCALYLLRPFNHIPDFILYNLSDGLWAFSFSLCICMLWKQGPILLLWLCVFLLSAIVMEFGQLYSLIPGTYDPLDIFMYCCGTITAFLYHRKSIHHE